MLTATINANEAAEPTSARWAFGDGTKATGLVTTKRYRSSGAYTVTFTASNDGGAASASCRVEVSGPSALQDGLVAHYPLDGNVGDAGANSNDGSVTGNVSFVSGIEGQAARFGGFGERGYITVPDDPSLSFEGRASFSMWARVDDSYGQGNHCDGDGREHASQRLLAKSGDRYGFQLGIGTDEANRVSVSSKLSDASYSNNDVAGASSRTDVHEGEWFHVVYVFSQSGTRIHVNGRQVAQDDRPADFRVANDEDMYLGIQKGKGSCLPFWYPLDGVLDEVRIYNRALTGAEAHALFDGSFREEQQAGKSQSDSQSEQPLRFAVVEEPPRPAGKSPQARISYPAFAKRADIEGTVYLQFVVDKQGRPRNIEVLRTPHDVLSREAIRALEATTFEPGQQGGETVAVRMSMPISFRQK